METSSVCWLAYANQPNVLSISLEMPGIMSGAVLEEGPYPGGESRRAPSRTARQDMVPPVPKSKAD